MSENHERNLPDLLLQMNITTAESIAVAHTMTATTIVVTFDGAEIHKTHILFTKSLVYKT